LEAEILENGLLEVIPGPDQIDDAGTLAKKMKNLKNSVTRGRCTKMGCLGELVVCELLEAEYCAIEYGQPNYHADIKCKNKLFQVNATIGPKLIDVKTTTVPRMPEGYYNASITQHDRNVENQGCFGYVFCGCLSDLSKLWVAGWIQRDAFYKAAYFLTPNPKRPNDFPKAPVFNVSFSDLIQFKWTEILSVKEV